MDIRCKYCNWLMKEVQEEFVCKNCNKANKAITKKANTINIMEKEV